eukprot:jgi/Ulvmu1/3360/UM156_0017.1
MSFSPDTASKTGDFIQWYQKHHGDDYKTWRHAVQASTSMLVTAPSTGESDDNFTHRVIKNGAKSFQSAMWQVHDSMANTSSWPALAEGEQKLLMQATQLFLLRVHRIRGVELVASAETAQVDSRLHRLCGALSSSLELDNWKFDKRIKEAISGSDASFATLCQAAEALVSLDFHKSDKHDPLYILNTFKGFTQAVIHFLKDTGSEPSMDSQVDVAIHTLVQTAPPALYLHLKVVEQLLWEPWGQSAEAQFAMLLMSSVVIALYTINTTHFNVDSHLLLGIMASHGFDAAEFQARDSKAGLPPPFGTGPPLGQSRARESLPGQRSRTSPRQSSTSERQKGGTDSSGATGAGMSRYLGRLEKTGSSLIQTRGFSQSLTRMYPYLLQTSEDLMLRDVEDLLEQYKSLVMRYESLKAGLANGQDKK